MSFDLGVWYPQKRIRSDEATKLYVRICDGDTSGVVPHPAVDAFYAELTARHPEIDTIPEEKIDDHDYCPWSCKLDHSPGHVVMSCVWPKATHVYQLVQGLARKYGLALYDPQSEEVIYPDGSKGGKTNTSRSSLWILGLFALVFAAMFIYSGQITSSGTPLAFYVFAGLCVLMAVACFTQAWRSGDLERQSKMSSGRLQVAFPFRNYGKFNMDQQVAVETDLFEHRKVKPHFINPCCFGEDFAVWLKKEVGALERSGFSFSEIVQEDYGWVFWAWRGKDPFCVALSYVADAPQEAPAQWVISVKYDPGLNLLKRLFRRVDPKALEQVRGQVRRALESNAAIRIVPPPQYGT